MKPDRQTEPEPQRAVPLPLGILLFSLTRSWRTRLNQRLRPLGASAAVLGALYHLLESEEGLCQRDLAELIGVEGSTLVRLLDNMERDGWVVRVPSARDRRQKLIQVTDKACTAYATLARTARELNEQVVSVLTAEELAAMSAMFEKLTRQVERL